MTFRSSRLACPRSTTARRAGASPGFRCRRSVLRDRPEGRAGRLGRMRRDRRSRRERHRRGLSLDHEPRVALLPGVAARTHDRRSTPTAQDVRSSTRGSRASPGRRSRENPRGDALREASELAVVFSGTKAHAIRTAGRARRGPQRAEVADANVRVGSTTARPRENESARSESEHLIASVVRRTGPRRRSGVAARRRCRSTPDRRTARPRDPSRRARRTRLPPATAAARTTAVRPRRWRHS